MKGFFITFEGGEGSGKSIQVQILVSHLREKAYPVVVTREPGGTRIGEQIRAITHNQENVDLDPVTEAYLMAASRAQHIREILAPALEAGKVVVCDRFVDSSVAYQGYGRQIGAQAIALLNNLAVNGAVPDLTILLDIAPEAGMKRRASAIKVQDRLDLQQHDFYQRVRDGFLTLAKKNSNRYVVIDAAQSIEKVAASVWNVVKKKLPKI